MVFAAVFGGALGAASGEASGEAWAQQAPSGKIPPGKLTAADIRPPADMLVDCAKGPKEAVTTLQPDLERWATIYCTNLGYIFNANDKFYGIFPDSGLRASFSAGDIDGKTGADTATSYFTSISYLPMSEAGVAAILKVDPGSTKVMQGKKAYRLDLTTNGGRTLSFAVIDPDADPFWLFPITDQGLATPAFFVISLATLNRTR